MAWKKGLVLLMMLACCMGVGKGWHWLRSGFRVDRCDPLAFSWVGRPPTPEQARALSAPLRFLGAGRQCYAFESADGCFVLKLPRTDLHRGHPHRKAVFSRSVELALGALNEETRLAAVDWREPVTLIDRLGRAHALQGSTWLLQPKWPLLDPASSKELEALLAQVREKGFRCKDYLSKGNIGFDGRRAYFIDIGGFCPP